MTNIIDLDIHREMKQYQKQMQNIVYCVCEDGGLHLVMDETDATSAKNRVEYDTPYNIVYATNDIDLARDYIALMEEKQ